MKIMQATYTRSTILSLGILVFSFLSFNSWASEEVNGIYYNLKSSDRTAEVTFSGTFYTGKVIIPESFVFDGVTYSVTSIGEYAFYGCSELTSVTIPTTVKTLVDKSFKNCTGLTSVTIPNSVTSIGQEVFRGCTGLTSVKISNQLTAISRMAFYDCSGLTSVTIPNGVTTLDDFSFCGCASLTSIAIPSSVNNIGSRAFSGCSGLTSIMVNSNNTRYDSRDNCNAIIETATNKLVVGCKKTSIPSSVTTIGDDAFFDCSGLASIVIPNSVTTIESYVFFGCTSLTSITCESKTPASVIYSSFESFDKSNCILYVPAGSKSSYENAEGWNEFEHIVEIGNGQDILATGQCGDNVTYTIYSDMSMVISGTGEMCSYTNYGNFGLHINDDYYHLIKKVIIEDGVTRIGGSAFRGCTRLISIDIPNSVTSFEAFAFEDCTSLASIEIPSGVTELGVSGTFRGCSSFTSITIPNGVGYIGMGLFRSCTGLTFVEIPNSVTSIYEGAFGDCTSLASITIPNGVTEIDENAFSGCTGLTSITCESETPASVESSSFGGVDKSNCILHVPFGSKTDYENAAYWNEFKNIEELDNDISALTNAIYVDQIDGVVGGTMDIPVKMKSDFAVRGFQFTMELPEGATINSWQVNPDRLPSGISASKVLPMERIEGNRIVATCVLNDGNKTFTGNDGVIATVNVTFGSDMEAGTYPIYLTEASISDATSANQKVLSDVKATLVLDDYVVGDTNGDGKVLVGDVISILNYIVGERPEGFNVKAADVNSDGKILVGDVIAVLNIIVGL